MRRSKQTFLTTALIILSAAAGETACARGGAQNNQPPQSQPPRPSPAREEAREGWQHYRLDGGGGDQISALLPKKPEDFGEARMKRPSGEPLTARVYMLSAEAKVYFVIFVDLPRPAQAMSREERTDHFHGTWVGLAAKTRQALEEKFGAPFPVTESAGKVGESPGGERHTQDFKVGTESGRAQAIFAGQRVYMVAAVWNNRPGSEEDARRFLSSFQVYRRGQ